MRTLGSGISDHFLLRFSLSKARNFCPYHGDSACVFNSKGLLREVPLYTGL